MRCFKCNSPDHLLSSCPEKQLYAEEHGAVARVQGFLVDGMQKCFNMGVPHTQTAGLMADNHFPPDTGPPRPTASQKWFRNNGAGLESHGRNPHTVEPGGAMFKFGNGNVAKSFGPARTGT